MSWIILVIAGLLEVVWAVGLKYTHGFSRLTPSVITGDGDDCQYGATCLGDEIVTSRDGLCRVDGYWRSRRGHHRHCAAR